MRDTLVNKLVDWMVHIQIPNNQTALNQGMDGSHIQAVSTLDLWMRRPEWQIVIFTLRVYKRHLKDVLT